MADKNADTLYHADAQFYDLDNRPALKEDFPFYVKYASKLNAAGPILELACGTGRITIPLAEAGHEVWALEYSQTMIDLFNTKIKKLPRETAAKIHLLQGDMSNFNLDRSFPFILLPARSFQLLLDENKENACLANVYKHLTVGGHFIIVIGNYTKHAVDDWANEEETFDWENIDPVTKYKVRRTHIKKKIDTQRQILYPQKIYRIFENNGNVKKIVKQSAWKYFSEEQIKKLLISNGLEIIEEMGYFDGRPLNEGSEFIFICRKNK